MGGRSSTWEGKVKEILSRLAQLPSLAQSVSTSDSHVQTITDAVGTLSIKVAGIEPYVSALAARVLDLESGTWSASGVSLDPQEDLGSCSGTLMVPLLPVSRDPGSVDDRNMPRKLETNPDDEKLAQRRSLALPHARKVVHALLLGSPTDSPNPRNRMTSNARAGACRPELPVLSKAVWHDARAMACSIQWTLLQRHSNYAPVFIGGVPRCRAPLCASVTRPKRPFTCGVHRQ